MSPRLLAGRVTRRWLATGLAAATAATGIAVAVALATQANAAVLPNGFKSVGYMPSWAGSVNAVQYNKLTHINYSFVLPNANGTLQAVAEPVQAARRWCPSPTPTTCGSPSRSAAGTTATTRRSRRWPPTPTTRTTFVNNLVNLVNQYGLDGVDMDWEYPDPGTSGNNFTALMQQLSTAMHSRGKLLTAAVVSGGTTANGVQTGGLRLRRLAQHHGLRRRQPARQLRLGDQRRQLLEGPRPARAQDRARRAVLQPARRHHVLPAGRDGRRPTPTVDCTTVNGAQQCYNGLPTIRRKTQWAMANAGGIMNWELSQDTTGSTSLVSAIYEVATGGNPPPPPPPTNPPARGSARSPASPASASTSPPTARPTAPPSSCGPATAPPPSAGRSAPTARCAPSASAWTSTSAGTANGTKIQLWDCNGTGAQVWQAQANGTLRNPALRTGASTRPAPSSADGTRLQIWDCFASANQIWRLP